MELTSLTAISPIDGRYRGKLESLAPFMSEWALMKYRVWVEVEYFIALETAGILNLGPRAEESREKLRDLYRKFDETGGNRIKTIEKTTNHDVKAVEYYIKEQIADFPEEVLKASEFVHFGLTSQDINNTAQPMMLRDALQKVVIPGFEGIIEKLDAIASEWSDIPMLARTHGQPASPTRLDKELQVFVARLKKQLNVLKGLEFPAKFGGATGNLNAHFLAYPETDWHDFANEFVTGLGLSRSQPTTQIEHYDGLGEIFDCIKRLNTILIDLCVDVWLYISNEYFLQKTVAGEIGSSAMPHKVNPIDFENAEGNMGLGNSILEFMSRKLPVSRWQRDLTDSTILRNVGVALGHTLLGILSVQKGLSKLKVNRGKIAADLEKNWAVVAEALQTILRREGFPKPYETLKDLTRGNHQLNGEVIADFIETLDVSEKIKAEMRAVTPSNYVGR